MSLFVLLPQSQPMWRAKDWAALAVICTCCLGTPFPLSNSFFRVPQIWVVEWNLNMFFMPLFGLWLHILLSALKPWNTVLGFWYFWKDFWSVLCLCEQLSMPFYYVSTNIPFPREASETSSHSSIYFRWYCHESIPSASYSTKMLVREVLKNEGS